MTDSQAILYALAAIGTLGSVVSALYWALNKANEGRLADRDTLHAARIKESSEAHAAAQAAKDRELERAWQLVKELRDENKASMARDDALATTMRELREAVLAQARGSR